MSDATLGGRGAFFIFSGSCLFFLFIYHFRHVLISYISLHNGITYDLLDRMIFLTKFNTTVRSGILTVSNFKDILSIRFIKIYSINFIYCTLFYRRFNDVCT